jgi:hypothetical protein
MSILCNRLCWDVASRGVLGCRKQRRYVQLKQHVPPNWSQSHLAGFNDNHPLTSSLHLMIHEAPWACAYLKRSTGATTTERSPSSRLLNRRSISVPPRSAIETGTSSHVSGTRKLYCGISLHPTPWPPDLPVGLVYTPTPGSSGSAVIPACRVTNYRLRLFQALEAKSTWVCVAAPAVRAHRQVWHATMWSASEHFPDTTG